MYTQFLTSYLNMLVTYSTLTNLRAPLASTRPVAPALIRAWQASLWRTSAMTSQEPRDSGGGSTPLLVLPQAHCTSSVTTRVWASSNRVVVT